MTTRPLTATIVLAVLALMCGVAAPAQANTIYVSTTGNDANPGTIDQPVATPGRALQLAGAGDTIYLRAGTYTITHSLSVTQANLTISSYPGEQAAIVGGTTDLTGLTSIIIEYASGVSILNLEIQGGSYYGIKLDNMNGPQSGIRVAGCYIHHTGRDALKTQDSDSLVVENNEIAYTGVRDSTNAEGIDTIGSLGITIRGNHIHDIATNGLYIKGGTVNGVVEDNLVERTGYAGIMLGSETDAVSMRNNAVYQCSDSVARNNIVVSTQMAGLGTVAGNNVRFENNTVVNAAASAQGAFRAAPDQYGTSPGQVLFKNNVVTLSSGSARPLVYLYDFTGTLTSDYNIWFSPSGGYLFEVDSSSGATFYNGLAAWQSGMNIDWHSDATDPQLDTGRLYIPMAGSPAIDAGVTLSDVPADYAGVVRPQGQAYDIGAYEVVPAQQAPAAPSSLIATGVSPSRINLSWTDNSANEDGFRIERSTDGTSFTLIATAGINVTSYQDAGLKRNRTYYYRVAAYNSGGLSAYTNVAATKTPRK